MNGYVRTVKVYQQKEEWGGGHFQGDVLLQDGKLPQVSCFNSVCSKEQLWPDATLYYCIREKSYNMGQIEQIQDAAKEIQEKTGGCVNLFRVPEKQKENYLDIKPIGAGCASYIGMIGGPQDLALDHKSLFNIGTIMHVFLHALGLHHEHIREDRDNHININWENIHQDHWKNFSKVDNTLTTYYDHDSLLHWSSKVFAIDPSQHTLSVKKPNAKIGQRERLSEIDIEKLQVLYGAISPKESKYFKSFNEKEMFKPAGWVNKTPAKTVKSEKK